MGLMGEKISAKALSFANSDPVAVVYAMSNAKKRSFFIGDML